VGEKLLSIPGDPTPNQTQKKWLAARPPAETVRDLQHQLLEFQNACNTKRPHTLAQDTHYRIRIDPDRHYWPKILKPAGRWPAVSESSQK
jgi:hypothetical protein